MITDQQLEMVEDALRRALASEVDLLDKASARLIRSGGKRMRPTIALLSFLAVGGQDIERAVPVAAAVELLHTASLVHDDINDESELRRGQPTVNAQWGDGLALLVGDYVFIKVLRLLATFDARVIQILADCCTAIVEGETLQMLHRGDYAVDEAFYLDIIRRKTASLFGACGELGGVLAGAGETQIAALGAYGINLGIAFQIRDDALDLVGQPDALGKPVNADLSRGNLSLAVLYALGRAGLTVEGLQAGDRSRMLRLLREAGALDYVDQRARTFAAEAVRALSALPESEARRELHRLADYAVARDS